MIKRMVGPLLAGILGGVLATGVPAAAQRAGLWNLATQVSGILGATHGGTGFGTVAQGDLVYGTATDTLGKLAKDAGGSRYLTNQGTSNNPAWTTIPTQVSPGGSTGNLQTNNGSGGLGAYGGATATAGSFVTAISASGATTVSNLWIPQLVQKLADETVSATTAFQSDDELVFALPASQTWLLRYTLLINGNASGDMKICPNVPSGATGHFAANAVIDASATSATGPLAALSVTTLTDSCGFIVGAIASDVPVNWELYVTTGVTAGNAVLRWTQATATGTLTVKAGSYLEAIRVQ